MSSLIRPNLKQWIQFWSSQFGDYHQNEVQSRVSKMTRACEYCVIGRMTEKTEEECERGQMIISPICPKNGRRLTMS